MTETYLSWPVRAQNACSQIDASSLPFSQREALKAYVTGSSAAISALEDKVFVPGLYRCPKCRTRRQARIGTPTGSVPDPTPQRCPEDCGPMWRVAWADEARDATIARNIAITERDELLRIFATMNCPAISPDDIATVELIKSRSTNPNG